MSETRIHSAIRAEPLDAAAIEASVELPGVGGVCVFKGAIRPTEGGEPIEWMDYEHYPGMAERELERVARDAAARWPLLALAVEHRVGRVPVGEAAVVVAAGAGHRAEAFEACRFVIETIKQSVPIWKASDAGPGQSEARRPEEREDAAPKPSSTSAFGCMKGTVKILGDIEQPIAQEDWLSGDDPVGASRE